MSKSKNYVNDRELYYQLVLCKGLGKRTPKLENMLLRIVEGVAQKKMKFYKSADDYNDCLQTSYLVLLSNWHKFNSKKYDTAFSYMSEIAKRALTQGFQEVLAHKPWQETPPKFIRMDVLFDGKSGW